MWHLGVHGSKWLCILHGHALYQTSAWRILHMQEGIYNRMVAVVIQWTILSLTRDHLESQQCYGWCTLMYGVGIYRLVRVGVLVLGLTTWKWRYKVTLTYSWSIHSLTINKWTLFSLGIYLLVETATTSPGCWGQIIGIMSCSGICSYANVPK